MPEDLEVKQYQRRSYEVDAVLVTEENLEAVAKWCGGDVRTHVDKLKYIKVRAFRPMNERQSKAFVGDYVLYAGTGYKVYTANAFNSSFVAGTDALINHWPDQLEFKEPPGKNPDNWTQADLDRNKSVYDNGDSLAD